MLSGDLKRRLLQRLPVRNWNIGRRKVHRIPENHSKFDLPFPEILDKSWHLQASLFLAVVGGWGKSLLGLNDVKVYNGHRLKDYIYNREKSVPLLTVTNHASMLDDPALMASLMNFKTLVDSKRMRWSLAAKEICFANKFYSYISSHGKVIPIVRGDGIYQAGVNFAIKQLKSGGWVHIFPEGKVTMETIRLKWGVGRMISECLNQPIVLPFYHLGMEDVLPCTKPYIPRIRKKVTVLFGEPIPCGDLLRKYKNGTLSEIDARKAITDVIQDALIELRVETEKLHAARINS